MILKFGKKIVKMKKDYVSFAKLRTSRADKEVERIEAKRGEAEAIDFESKLPQSISDRQAGIKILQEKYDVLASKIKRLYNLYASNGDELLLETIKENQKEMADVSKMLNSEKASAAAVEDIIERETAVKNLRNCWDNLTLQEKQRVLRICINRVIITDNKVDIEYLI